MKNLSKVVTVLAKIIEVSYWIVSAFMIAMTAVLVTGHKEWMKYLSDIDIEKGSAELSQFGFSISGIDKAGHINYGAYIIFFITLFIVSGLMAMVFRNIYLTFKTAEGKTRFSKGETPFQKDIVRMVREIGIFCISVYVVELIMSVIAAAIYGFDVVETSVEITGVMMGLVVLCLSQFFAYGVELEEETKGLI